jgi:hypothetical protein
MTVKFKLPRALLLTADQRARLSEIMLLAAGRVVGDTGK